MTHVDLSSYSIPFLSTKKHIVLNASQSPLNEARSVLNAGPEHDVFQFSQNVVAEGKKDFAKENREKLMIALSLI